MRPYSSRRQYVCLPCLLKDGRQFLSSSQRSRTAQAGSSSSLTNSPETQRISQSRKRPLGHRTTQAPLDQPNLTRVRRLYSADASESIKLSEAQLNGLQAIHKLRNRLETGASQLSTQLSKPPEGLSIEEALQNIPRQNSGADQEVFIPLLQEVYAGCTFEEVKQELDSVLLHRRLRNSVVVDKKTKAIIGKLGLLYEADTEQPNTKHEGQDDNFTARVSGDTGDASNQSDLDHTAEWKSLQQRRKAAQKDAKHPTQQRPTHVIEKVSSSASNIRATGPTVRKVPTSGSGEVTDRVAELESRYLQAVSTNDLSLRPLLIGDPPKVPQLSFDLARVLFNPGIYQLRDPRSRVYNFDPYLEHIMPVTEFNYDVLNKYVTSSEDELLRNLALEHRKKYVGSSSSMSGALQHFHFLLSQWRQLQAKILSNSFTSALSDKGDAYQVTAIQKAPSAIFLRYSDGVYAVDADKEYDSANVLMHLGRSMEKLFTVEKDEFERYRKNGENLPIQPDPEAFHYSEMGQFLLRSQLDAHDPRLPGTGMFDLKTRAVVSIRMNMSGYEQGVGYEIRGRFGPWESYEREYFDMVRSAFLKYSLQARMGRMDGIFVAYHNVERIFGFQYVALPELDLALHGQTNRTLGDQEFKISINLLNEVFNRATSHFPKQSLRFHFQTMDKDRVESVPYMYIFAEPVTDEEVQRIQESKKEQIEEMNQKMLADGQSNEEPSASVESVDSSASEQEQEAPSPGQQSNAADVEFLDQITQPASKMKEKTLVSLLGWKLTIRNIVNGEPVVRPNHLIEEDEWKVEYNLTPLGDTLADKQYTALKNRRASAFEQVRRENAPVSGYLRGLYNLSDAGRKWRVEQNELDAEREKVVLYSDRIRGGSTS